ncbi:hypothetical protein COV20_06080 [Candidatus Woesearchaeota archaeon CG10_big_fil_rev_8_21_14_0_10_45_16]|nr:MAG: hypothetical protein COV20_06080 [Candidatus Woesearchaeota archaeon CG10_big_fil_rev_8_21_14_0_10_45_16]
MGVESICLREAAHLVKRSPKYWHLVGKLYLEGLANPHSAKVFRAAYFFCRHIDDVLDGDRSVTVNPEAYVRDILSAVENGHQGPPIVELYKFAIGPIKEMATETDDPKSYFIRVIKDAMLFDFERAKERRVLTRDEIEQYYDDTFTPVTNIALIIAGSQQRIRDVPEMVTTQGHIYTIRDLTRDLEQGIINVPSEELQEAGLNGKHLSYDVVRRNPVLSSWMDNEVERYSGELKVAREKLSDAASRKVCFPLIWQMNTYCKLYQLGLHK